LLATFSSELYGQLPARIQFDLAPDGKRFAVVLNPGGMEERLTDSVTVLVNFFDELRRKVPLW
jgi:hypothetical protein